MYNVYSPQPAKETNINIQNSQAIQRGGRELNKKLAKSAFNEEWI